MPIYFLHLRRGNELIEDFDGSLLPDLDAAKAEAFAAAREMLAERVKAGKLLNGETFEITDDTGTVLATLPLRDALVLD
ncbi:hypothetical protein GCM10007884_50630 [Methylobacterium brachythecii]|nr:hypothetical protein GCM10007884_50630 [Methylobacterium brachythecii]